MAALADHRPHLSGKLVICCVHDRIKRRVLDLSYDSAKEKVQVCPCCENLFTTPDDTPRLCDACSGPPVHAVAAPLPDPVGIIHG